MEGKTILENNLLLNKKYFGSVYINPTYFVPLCYPFLKTLNHPLIPYQNGVLLVVQGL